MSDDPRPRTFREYLEQNPEAAAFEKRWGERVQCRAIEAALIELGLLKKLSDGRIVTNV